MIDQALTGVDMLKTYEVCFCLDGSRVTIKAEGFNWSTADGLLSFFVNDQCTAMFNHPQFFKEVSANEHTPSKKPDYSKQDKGVI